MEILEVTEGEEARRWQAVLAAAHSKTVPLEGYEDWRRQAEETVWLLGTEGGEDVAAGIALTGWYSLPHQARADVRVAPGHRGLGHALELYRALSGWAAARGVSELEGEVREDDTASLTWAERQGFRESGRNSRLVLDLTGIEAPAAEPPAGIELVTWAERPELARGMYEVALEAGPDIPGEEEIDVGSFERWLDRDMQGAGDRPEATFVALADGEVVGYAKLSLSLGRDEVVMHDLTGVLRAWRGRGIASALKRTQIAWAKNAGYAKLETSNEVRNEPIRRLNERYGYLIEPGEISLLGPVSAT